VAIPVVGIELDLQHTADILIALKRLNTGQMFVALGGQLEA
jgi:hypothetical protein